MWDIKPWGNDGAADWYGDVMDATNLRKHWLAGIKSDPVESPDVVRAAAGLFVMLGRVYIWPINSYDENLELAINQLQKIIEGGEYEELPELISLIEMEIAELESRRKPKGANSKPSISNPWWKFW